MIISLCPQPPGRKEYALQTDLFSQRHLISLFPLKIFECVNDDIVNIRTQFSMSVQPMNPHNCGELNIKVACWCLTVTLEFICMFLKIILLFNIYEAFLLSVLLFRCHSCYTVVLGHVPCRHVVPTVNETIWPRSPRYYYKKPFTFSSC